MYERASLIAARKISWCYWKNQATKCHPSIHWDGAGLRSSSSDGDDDACMQTPVRREIAESIASSGLVRYEVHLLESTLSRNISRLEGA